MSQSRRIVSLQKELDELAGAFTVLESWCKDLATDKSSSAPSSTEKKGETSTPRSGPSESEKQHQALMMLVHSQHAVHRDVLQCTQRLRRRLREQRAQEEEDKRAKQEQLREERALVAAKAETTDLKKQIEQTEDEGLLLHEQIEKCEQEESALATELGEVESEIANCISRTEQCAREREELKVAPIPHRKAQEKLTGTLQGLRERLRELGAQQEEYSLRQLELEHQRELRRQDMLLRELQSELAKLDKSAPKEPSPTTTPSKSASTEKKSKRKFAGRFLSKLFKQAASIKAFNHASKTSKESALEQQRSLERKRMETLSLIAQAEVAKSLLTSDIEAAVKFLSQDVQTRPTEPLNPRDIRELRRLMETELPDR